MPNYNKIIFIGHLTRNPELTYLPSNTPVVDCGIAANRKWKDKDGNAKEEVCFVDFRAYGKTAENIHKYLKKGRPVLLEGRLTFDQWDAQDGSKRSKQRIFVENFTFVDSQQQNGNQGQQQAPAPLDDDIPF